MDDLITDPELRVLQQAVDALPDSPAKLGIKSAMIEVVAMCNRRSKLSTQIQLLLEEMRQAISTLRDELDIVKTDRDLYKNR